MSDIRSGSTKCSCGRAKYPDASCCERCWNQGWDERSPDDAHHCSCGRPKYADAATCDECWGSGGYADR